MTFAFRDMINLRLHPKNLVLASQSPRRKELLERLGLSFEIAPAHADEIETHLDGPAQMVLCNAAMKAEALAAVHHDSLVLGSDTTVVLGERILGKPTDMQAAKETLMMLSGQVHTVYTAVALRWDAQNFVDDFVEASHVRFRVLDEATVDAYFKLVNPLDKAGAYGIQQGREMIIEAVEGSVENVMGLPIQRLELHLKEHGFSFQD